MQVFIIAALSADGYIAKHENHFINWSTKEDKLFFTEKTKEAGVVIIGANTYHTLPSPLEGRTHYVYTNKPDSIEPYPNVNTTQLPPPKLIHTLMEQGHHSVAVIGGSSIYTQFMQSGLVNTLYLTIEPILFGTGLTLFNQEVSNKISLDQVHTLSTQSIVLEYQVLKA